MAFQDFVQWAFYGILSGSIIVGVGILKQLVDSVKELDAKIAIIIEKTTWHEKELNRHDDRLSRLEEYKS